MSHAGILGALERATKALKTTYLAIQEGLVKSPVVCADETGWWLHCGSAWLWVFTNRIYTLNIIRQSRGHKVAEEVLGKTADRFFSRPTESWTVLRPSVSDTCSGYSLKPWRCRHGAECASRGAAILLLKGAMELKLRKRELTDETYRGLCCVYRHRLSQLLARDIQEAKNQKAARRKMSAKYKLTILEKTDAMVPGEIGAFLRREGLYLREAEYSARPAVHE